MTYEELQDAIDHVERLFSQALKSAVQTPAGDLVSIFVSDRAVAESSGKFYGPKTQMVIDAARGVADQLESDETARRRRWPDEDTEDEDTEDEDTEDEDTEWHAAAPTGYRVTAFWAPGCRNAGGPCNYGAYETYEEAQKFVEWLAKGAFIGDIVVDVSIEEVYE